VTADLPPRVGEPLAPTTAEAIDRLRPRGRIALVLGLFVLSPVCAEYLAAYDSSTGDPAELLLGLLILGPLYGAAAVLIRETARRAGLGWRGIILLAAAAGVLQAGVVDQSVFSVSYRGIESWEASRQGTLIAPLGVSAHMAQLFVAGHVIYSFGAPIALVEAFAASDRREPWLGPMGLAVMVVLYAGAAAFVLADHLANEASQATAAQVGAALLVAGALVTGAFVWGRPARRDTDRNAARPGAVFAASLVAASVVTAAPESWTGVGLAVGVLALAGACLAHASRAAAWDARHGVSVASGALVSRGILAFTYYPVVGDVAATPKYLHNLALFVAMAAIGMLALRRASEPAARVRAASGPR
jgi:hypothetical protein